MEAVESHVAQFGPDETNDAMISRLWDALDRGGEANGADANYYLHELKEAELTSQGLNQETAHQMALEHYEASPYSIYHPDVIRAFPDQFNNNWLAYWGLPLR